jgi:predicted unusual protein kinase regulating ubiquinone biosynthesis (AarF/ABC1/UbiB family)
MSDEPKRKDVLPTGWLQRGAKIAGQTGRSAARFVGTRARTFAAPDRANEFLEGFHQQTAKQLVQMLGEMKGAAMKVGQLASFYEFSAPSEYLATYKDALTMLQNSAPPMDPEASRQVIKEEFGAPAEEVFATFDENAFAAASIGQVHRATLHSGEEVAVKVQYPGVDEAVRADLKNVSAMTKISVAIAPNIDPKEIANEVRDRVLEELDYRREASNQATFADLYDGHPFIVVPKVYKDLCRARVITQEFIKGRPFPEAFGWEDQHAKDQLGETLWRFFFGSMNRFLLFSADPHPGNYLLLPRGKVAFLDFGLVRAIDPGTLKLFVELGQAFVNDDKERGRSALEGMGILNRRTPEIDVVWEHMKMLNSPLVHKGPLKITPSLVQGIAAAGFDPRSPAFNTLRKVGIPGVVITFNRMSFGVASLMARLEATAHWQGLAQEMWFGEPSETALGKKEQAWFKKMHPDVPPSAHRT